MPIDLTGITNENEFYTHHYLAAILEGDLRALFENWAKLEIHPWDGLRGLARPFQTMRKELEATSDPEERLAVQRTWFGDLFGVLGYFLQPDTIELEGGELLPLAGQVTRANGQADLWFIEALDGRDEEDPLVAKDELLTKQVFAASEPPRWVLLYGGTQLLLIDRTKWPSKRLLRFDLEEILGRRESSTLRAVAALLHRDSVCPADQISLLDRLDENSHKHAFAVSEDLKYSAREAVELLGNEAVWYLREVLKEGVYGKDLAEQLTRECLRYLYRLLFLFYVEAREELGYAPMKSEEYRTGYSLESLREAAETQLSTEEDRTGYFLHHSLQVLFRLIYDGWRHELKPEQVGDYNFRMEPLRCDLFDPSRTPLLNRVRLRNHVLQRVIELLSLSREESGRRRGRISYSQLGINQLGAVYEGLLSYSGFFVEPEGGLYEVQQKPKNEKKEDEQDDDVDSEEPRRHLRASRKPQMRSFDPLKPAHFATAKELDAYEESERVFDDRGSLVHHPRGKFIYRLRGRDRQKSASYYTPEVLTQTVVKYALKDLLNDRAADDILRLCICEPALGSGAFLNEAVNQLAEAYLERKQHETGRIVPHEDYLVEKQKVKAYLADNCVYGVDRNPVAIELAQVSLWLNTIYERHTIPWFGGQLVVGNSLVGARRQVFFKEQLESDTREWLDVIPKRVKAGEQRKDGQVWHFLVPDKGMADYSDKAVKQLFPDETNQARNWRREFAKRFSSDDTKALEHLSAAVDRLWKRHMEDLRQVRTDTAHIFPIFGQEANPTFNERGQRLSTHERDDIFERSIKPRGGQASAYQRLKLAMDYWCALWFWPVSKAALLPSRDEFLIELAAILEGTDWETRPILGAEQEKLFLGGKPKQEQFQIADELGTVNLEKLCADLPRLKTVSTVAAQHRFMHWQLEFADLFEDHGGFDLILGNPPWIKIEWNEVGVMGDAQPLYVLRKFSAPQMKELRREILTKYPEMQATYLDEYVESQGTQNYVNARQNYHFLAGTQSNSYKCFLTQGWMLGGERSVQGFLHPEGVYDDPNGGVLRSVMYSRLRYHFQFQNALNLFPEVAHREKYSVNIYGEVSPVSFKHLSNLFHPSTVDACFDHNGSGVCGGIKSEGGEWDLTGHRDRIIDVEEDTLALFARLYDAPGTTAQEARLPSLHSRELVGVLQKFSIYPKRLWDLGTRIGAARMWDETNAVSDGTIRRQTGFPDSPVQWIVSGPHISVGNPLSKTPRRICTEKSHYDPLDLTVLPAGYLPRTNYVPACDQEEYCTRIPVVPWGAQRTITDFYRFVNRAMLSQAGERTLVSAVIPPGVGSIHTTYGFAFESDFDLVDYFVTSISLPADCWIKTTAVPFASRALLAQLPIISGGALEAPLRSRGLMLTCLSQHYADLWRSCWNPAFCRQVWTKEDPRLSDSRFSSLSIEWCWETPLRTDYQRRQALVEIDVLVARALGITIDQLCAIYRIQFPVLRQNEQDTWYDSCGRIIFTRSKALPGIGFTRSEWDDVKSLTTGTVSRTVQDDTLPGGPRERVIEYIAPFDRCDREADYATAWRFFDEHSADAEAGAEL